MGPAHPRRARRRLLAAGVVLLVPIIAVGFQVEPRERIDHFAAREVSILAHAGAQGHAPDNTLEAFDLALELGADTLEMDLQLTADGEVVVIHDGTVDRTTDGSGAVADHTLVELKQLDAGYAWQDDVGAHPYGGTGVEIPTLAEVLEAYPDTHLILELKTDGGEGIIQPVIDLIVEHGHEDLVTVASFSLDYLQPVREQLPDVPTNMPEDETYAFYVRHLVGLHPWWEPPGQLFQVPEHFDGRRVVTPRFTRAAERLGIDVQVWTVNDREDMHRVLDAGAHAILTDYPDRLVEVLDERAADQAADPAGRGEQLALVERLQDEQRWLTPIMAAVTFLGDEEFYLLAFPLLYWAVSRRLGLRLGVMLLLSAGLNEVLKLVGTTPRPAFLDPGLERAPESSFGIPSGHAQNGAAVWGMLAVSLRRPWVTAAVVVLVAAAGWSRVHLGAHFVEDVVIGWLVGLGLLGLGLLGLVVWRGPRVRARLAAMTPVDQGLVAVVASLALVAPAVVLAGRLDGVRFPWPGLTDPVAVAGASATVTPAATLAGLGVGLALLHARGGFDSGGRPGVRAGRVLVGLIGVAVLWQGLGALFPSGEDLAALAWRYLRYGLVGAWVGGLAPLLFVRLGLASPAAPARTPEPAARA